MNDFFEIKRKPDGLFCYVGVSDLDPHTRGLYHHSSAINKPHDHCPSAMGALSPPHALDEGAVPKLTIWAAPRTSAGGRITMSRITWPDSHGNGSHGNGGGVAHYAPSH